MPRVPSISRDEAQKRMALRTQAAPVKSQARTQPAAPASPAKKRRKASR